MGVGDVCNQGSNSVVVINAEAKCFIFNIEGADRSVPVSAGGREGGKEVVFFEVRFFFSNLHWPHPYLRHLSHRSR